MVGHVGFRSVACPLALLAYRGVEMRVHHGRPPVHHARAEVHHHVVRHAGIGAGQLCTPTNTGNIHASMDRPRPALLGRVRSLLSPKPCAGLSRTIQGTSGSKRDGQPARGRTPPPPSFRPILSPRPAGPTNPQGPARHLVLSLVGRSRPVGMHVNTSERLVNSARSASNVLRGRLYKGFRSARKLGQKEGDRGDTTHCGRQDPPVNRRQTTRK